VVNDPSWQASNWLYADPGLFDCPIRPTGEDYRLCEVYWHHHRGELTYRFKNWLRLFAWVGMPEHYLNALGYLDLWMRVYHLYGGTL
jgi:hypothetical protein